MKKQIGFLLVMLVMLLTVSAAMADNVRKSGDFKYTVKGNGTATIVEYLGKKDDIILPNMVDGYTITTIGESAFEYPGSGFADASFSVTLPNTITSIEAFAFANRNLISINIPDSVEYIGYGAFLGNNEIQFRISNDHPCFATIDGCLYNKKNKELLKAVQTGGSIRIPTGILSIGDYAFANMSLDSLDYCYLPISLLKIGNYAFKNFDCFNGLEIPGSVCEIGSNAFEDAHLYH